MMPEIDVDDLEAHLSEALGRPTEVLAATALGANSRATPWRIDVRLDGE